MLDLDNLLTESVTLRNKEKQQKADAVAKKKQEPKLKRDPQWMSGHELAEHKEQVKKIRNKAEDWLTEGATVMFLNQCCQNCGAEREHFTGIFLRQSHRRFQATRYAQPTALIDYADLPREIEITNQYVPMCIECHAQQGWPEDLPTRINS